MNEQVTRHAEGLEELDLHATALAVACVAEFMQYLSVGDGGDLPELAKYAKVWEGRGPFRLRVTRADGEDHATMLGADGRRLATGWATGNFKLGGSNDTTPPDVKQSVVGLFGHYLGKYREVVVSGKDRRIELAMAPVVLAADLTVRLVEAAKPGSQDPAASLKLPGGLWRVLVKGGSAQIENAAKPWQPLVKADYRPGELGTRWLVHRGDYGWERVSDTVVIWFPPEDHDDPVPPPAAPPRSPAPLVAPPPNDNEFGKGILD